MIQAGQFFGYLAGLLVAVVIFAGGVFGQESTGTLRGQVTDQQGSVIVGATVEAVAHRNLVPTPHIYHRIQWHFFAPG